MLLILLATLSGSSEWAVHGSGETDKRWDPWVFRRYTGEETPAEAPSASPAEPEITEPDEPDNTPPDNPTAHGTRNGP